VSYGVEPSGKYLPLPGVFPRSEVFASVLWSGSAIADLQSYFVSSLYKVTDLIGQLFHYLFRWPACDGFKAQCGFSTFGFKLVQKLH